MLKLLEGTGICFLVMAVSGVLLYVGYMVWAVIKEMRSG